jgi:hypothetical protein
MLYCLDGISRDAVARDCNCSPSLITLRLQAIELKLWRKPAELRALSSQFEQIADSLTDSRARRIDSRLKVFGSVPILMRFNPIPSFVGKPAIITSTSYVLGRPSRQFTGLRCACVLVPSR